MRRRLLQWLCCPSCRGPLTLQAVREQAEAVPPPPPEHPFWLGQATDGRDAPLWDESWSREVLEGLLSCACGAAYPVRGGIPRLYDGADRRARDTVEPATSADRDRGTNGDRSPSMRTGKCYTELWKFKAGRIGWQHQRDHERNLFLRNMGVSRDDLPGQTLLDAGCGDGRFTSALSDFGIETIGIDLSEGVDVGYANNRSPLVHYVQGDLLKPPFRQRKFRFVWSFGVLHHTRSTKLALTECAGLLKDGGRLFVWLYDKAPKRRGAVIRATQKAPMPLKRLVSRAFGAGNRIKRALGGGNAATRTQSADEVYFWNLDMYGPEFRHLQEREEVVQWFTELGFENITARERMEFGFGLTGDLPTNGLSCGAGTAGLVG